MGESNICFMYAIAGVVLLLFMEERIGGIEGREEREGETTGRR